MTESTLGRKAAMALPFLFPVLFAGCCWFQGAHSGRAKAPELNGLRSSIVSLSWIDPDTLSLNYKLEWTGPNKTWLLEPDESFNFLFKDAAGADLKEIILQRPLDSAFINGTLKVFQITMSSKAPKAAAAVAMALGSSGLQTSLTTLPARP